MAGDRTIGALNLTIKARTAKFVKAMKNARKRIDRLKKSIPGLNFALSKMGALTAGIAGGGMLLMLKKTAENIDAQAKFADRIGASLKALGGLEHAANITGVKVEALRMGLQRMTRRVAEAAKGTGEAKDALRELGLDAGKLTKMRPEEAFKHIAEAMNGVEGQADRVRLAMKLFDSEGVALVNTLALGAKGLDKMTREADMLGIALSRADAAQVEAANDAITRMDAAISGALRSAVVELAPLIQSMADEFTSWASESGNIRNAAIDFAQGITGGAAQIVGMFNEARRAWLEFRKSYLQAQIDVTSKLFGGPKTEALLSIDRNKIFQIDKQLRGIKRFDETVSDINAHFETLRENAKRVADEIENGKRSAEGLGDAGAAAAAVANGDIMGLMEAWGRAIDTEKKAVAETVRLAGESKVVTDLVSSQAELWGDVGEAIKAAHDRQQDFTKGIEREIELLEAAESARGKIRLGHELEDLRSQGSELGVQGLDGLLDRLESARLAEMAKEAGDKIGRTAGGAAAQRFSETFTENVSDRNQEIVASLNFVGTSIGDVISAGVFGGVELASDAAKQVFERMIRDMIDMVIRSGILKIVNSLFGSVGGAGGGSGGLAGIALGAAQTFTGGGGGGGGGGFSFASDIGGGAIEQAAGAGAAACAGGT